MVGLAATDVIGRADELGAIQAFLADVRDGPTALVLSGEPGIGKTIRWENGVDEARLGFAAVLTCRGVEAEASLSFAGLSGVVRRQAQQRRSAREALEQAFVIFEELGARLSAEKTRGELQRISGRRALSEELTETERRVAELAAQGHRNEEIAAGLFMAVSTAEAHLSRVYRKLGIRSRGARAGRLARPVDAAVEGKVSA